MFEKATRLKLRFESSHGPLLAEDLWDLPLKSLDNLAVGLKRSLETDTTSFINERKPDETVQLRFDIAKHVIDVRLNEAQQAKDAKDRAQKKQQILGILATRENAKLEGASEDELRALLASL
ncbi:MAG TPA: hypothetical protein VNU68_35430 [Verrucomicrobiae bacterium]|nr:hypothetical protein [Verrucomicrobiae bacterium]